MSDDVQWLLDRGFVAMLTGDTYQIEDESTGLRLTIWRGDGCNPWLATIAGPLGTEALAGGDIPAVALAKAADHVESIGNGLLAKAKLVRRML